LTAPEQPARVEHQHEWRDLTHVLRETMPKLPIFAAPVIRKLRSTPEDPMNITEITVACHVGTHVDAPCHFIHGAPSVDQVPLDRLYGEAVVWALDVAPEGVVEVEDLARARPRAQPGDIVILDTGWWRHFEEPLYDRHPSLSVPAARWLVAQGVKLVGVDFGTPDLAVPLRSPGFDWPVHRVLLGAGVLIVEHVTNIGDLAGQRVDVVCLPLPIAGADGSPVRMIARPLSDSDGASAPSAGLTIPA
jgi:arylformamidase